VEQTVQFAEQRSTENEVMRADMISLFSLVVVLILNRTGHADHICGAFEPVDDQQTCPNISGMSEKQLAALGVPVSEDLAEGPEGRAKLVVTDAPGLSTDSACYKGDAIEKALQEADVLGVVDLQKPCKLEDERRLCEALGEELKGRTSVEDVRVKLIQEVVSPGTDIRLIGIEANDDGTCIAHYEPIRGASAFLNLTQLRQPGPEIAQAGRFAVLLTEEVAPAARRTITRTGRRAGKVRPMSGGRKTKIFITAKDITAAEAKEVLPTLVQSAAKAGGGGLRQAVGRQAMAKAPVEAAKKDLISKLVGDLGLKAKGVAAAAGTARGVIGGGRLLCIVLGLGLSSKTLMDASRSDAGFIQHVFSSIQHGGEDFIDTLKKVAPGISPQKVEGMPEPGEEQWAIQT